MIESAMPDEPTPVHLAYDAVASLLRSRDVRAMLDRTQAVDGPQDWDIRYAEVAETLSIVVDAGPRRFESAEAAAQSLFGNASGGGMGVRNALRERVLSLLVPAPSLARGHRSRFAHTSREQDLASALAACMFAVTSRDLIQRHRVALIDNALWLATERTPSQKYQTRYRSAGALDVHDPKRLAHEHVFTRGRAIEEILANPFPERILDVLSRAVGCTVLRTEHDERLSPIKGLDGWERYRAGGVRVYDCGAEGDQPGRLVEWEEFGL